MANGHSLDGLMKWAGRESWRAEMEGALAEHLGGACAAMDVEIEDLPDILGGAHFMNLWGCAFEDLAARDIDGRNLADDYLKRRGWKESAGARAYIAALRMSVMSLYEISDIRRDEGFFARDLLRGGDPVWVCEKSGTHYLAQWDRVAARILTVRGKTQMTGALLRFERETGDKVAAAFEEIAGASPNETAAEEVLAGAGSLFTHFWLRDALDRTLDFRPPQLFNSDGEAIEWVEVRYPLARGATQAKVREALAGIPALHPENGKFWNWLEEKRQTGKTGRRRLPEESRVLITEMEDGATVLGTLELKGRALTLSVNSRGREGRGRALIEPALEGLVGAASVERRSVEAMLADDGRSRKPGDRSARAADIPLAERRDLMQRYFEGHYARMLDEPIPAIGNISPRDAAKSEKTRLKAVHWLKSVENNHARMAANDPAQQYDCRWMWDELGLAAYRQS
ncbi:MAG: hypothetical protein ACE5FO_14245 [Parvularculaceae bacterium]